jgi:hypothetical protein
MVGSAVGQSSNPRLAYLALEADERACKALRSISSGPAASTAPSRVRAMRTVILAVPDRTSNTRGGLPASGLIASNIENTCQFPCQGQAPRTMRLALIVLAPLVALGCGRPATPQECEEIVTRVTELEVRSRLQLSDALVKSQVESTKQAMRERMMKDCVGQRITERAMECVRQAVRPEQVKKCFE